MNWFFGWPMDALRSVGTKFLADFPMVCNTTVTDSLIAFQESVCFVDFLRDPPEDLPEDGELDDIPKVYELVPSWDELKARLTYYQDEVDAMLNDVRTIIQKDKELSKTFEEEYDVLVRGGAAQTISAHPNDLSRWLPDQQWLNLVAMTQIPEFQILLTTIATNSNVWKKWYSQEAPEELPFPGGGRMDQLTPFQRLLLVRCLREDRTMLAATQYISASLGREFLEAVPLDLEGAVAESDPRTPLIVVLSAGADPTAALEALAKRTKTALLGVSMGQGQEVIARALMQQGMEQFKPLPPYQRRKTEISECIIDGDVGIAIFGKGAWVLLQNGHLSLRFLTELQALLIDWEALHFMLCEVANLDNASPATVSRAGIVYMSASSLGWRPVVQAWLQNRCDPRARPGSAPAPASPEVPLLKELFAQHVEPIFEFMHQEGLTMTDSEVVKSPGMLCRLWLHESSRVLSDKLNAQEDLGWFTYTIGSVLETVSSEATFLKSIQQQESVCFVDFLRD
eukprot:gene31676-39911_t